MAGAETAGSKTALFDAGRAEGSLRCRAASASTQSRYRSMSSSRSAPQCRANRSTATYSTGTARPAQYRCNADLLTCARAASASKLRPLRSFNSRSRQANAWT